MKKWAIVLEIGKMIDKVLLYVFGIALVMVVVGLISDAEWTMTAVKVGAGALVYSLVWFATVLFLVMPKLKEERKV